MNIKQWSAMKILAFGFALIITVGAILLSLPIASHSNTGIPFLNALFTSASATCVTGLVVYDTWSQFSFFGQVVILLLIQIGGLGFMAIAILFSLAVGRRIGLRERSLLAEAVSATQVGGVVRLVRRMLIGTAVIESMGALLLAIRFIPLFGFKTGLWLAIFHSVSAFCNAGFDLMGIHAPFSSLTTLYDDPLVILTIASLIIIGGIGFVVWDDLISSRFRFHKLRLHTKTVLVSTVILLLLGTIAFAFLEHDGVFYSMSIENQILSAFFQSVSPRTAGFNSINLASLSDGSKLVTMFLMFVGAAPGGTGGGIKVTTLAVIAATAAASLKGREDVCLWHFRVDFETIRRAFCSVTIYLAMAMIGLLVLCIQKQPFTDAAFEIFSAIGTVGLSTGITGTLAPLSRIAIIVLMFAGRVGSLTVFMAVAKTNNSIKLRNPTGKVIVG